MKLGSFEVIPAIDLRGGQVVRLHQGDYGQETVYADSPVVAARRFYECGARRLHVVDLDGARAGAPTQRDLVIAMANARGETRACAVEIGGGIRTDTDARAYLDAGLDFVILGTVALREPTLVRTLATAFPGRIIVGLDARAGMVAVSGWFEQSTTPVAAIAREFRDAGVAAVIYTDIARDGTGVGADVDGSARLAQAAGLPVIASGGIGSLADIEALQARRGDGVVGVVVGKALLSGAIDVRDALALSVV
jgi:phosphoribosylformimino-5-aminoimidazole carboxamide ribotide isomerase